MLNRRRDAIMGILYILPSLILICVFAVIPIIMNGYYSLTEYNVIQPAEWVGLKNYSRLFSDPFVKAAIKNTIVFTLISVPVQTALSLLIAAVLAERFRGKFGAFSRSALFIPVIASAVLVGTLWGILLSAHGPVNGLLQGLGLPTVNWLGGRNTALLSVCLATIWKNVGYFLVIYYAGILDIPVSLYEAAQVDGASAVQRFFRITLPGLSKITFLVVTLGTIWSFQVFDMVYTMTGGGPGNATVTLVLTIYNAAFKEYRMGFASAVSMVMLVFVMLISAAQKVLLRGGREAE